MPEISVVKNMTLDNFSNIELSILIAVSENSLVPKNLTEEEKSAITFLCGNMCLNSDKDTKSLKIAHNGRLLLDQLNHNRFYVLGKSVSL